MLLPLVASACGGQTNLGSSACTSDTQCSGAKVCFIDGCGDPGDGIIVEITPSRGVTALHQDRLLDRVRGREDIQLLGSPMLEGKVLRRSDGKGMSLRPYFGPVTFTGSGESLLLPGVSRSFQTRVDVAAGEFSFPVSSGRYTVVAYAEDASIPPVLVTGEANAGQASALNLVFPAESEIQSLEVDVQVPSVQVAPGGFTLQALSADASRRPLSQRLTIHSNGTYVLRLLREASSEISLALIPVIRTALVPSRTLRVAADADGGASLSLGDFGAALTVTGKLVDARGAPVPDASVYVEGDVNGGGTFQSASVKSGPDGAFAIPTLATASPGEFRLWALPPATSASGLLRRSVSVSSGAASLGTVLCPDRVFIQGSVQQPNFAPASGVRVTAVPIAAISDSIPTLSQSSSVVTDAAGAFSIALDPASYRIDFQSSDGLPVVSVFQDVQKPSDAIALPRVVLSEGRELRGTLLPQDEATVPIDGGPEAAIRFFRRVVDGSSTRLLPIAQTNTDAAGNYSITLPAR